MRVVNGSLMGIFAGCEISTGPGTNASEMLVGPVKKYGVFSVK